MELSFHLFPETNSVSSDNKIFNVNFYPEPTKRNSGNMFSPAIKKVIDTAGSALALLLFSPLFLIIAAAIKVTSPVPVFFNQERVGYNGRTFSMLKF